MTADGESGGGAWFSPVSFFPARAFRRPGPYLGAVLFAVMCLPNLIWLGGNDMVAFRYAFDRAALDDGAPAFAFTYERLLKYPEVAAVQIGSEKPDAYSKAESIGVEAFFSKDKERIKTE